MQYVRSYSLESSTGGFSLGKGCEISSGKIREISSGKNLGFVIGFSRLKDTVNNEDEGETLQWTGNFPETSLQIIYASSADG